MDRRQAGELIAEFNTTWDSREAEKGNVLLKFGGVAELDASGNNGYEVQTWWTNRRN